MVVSRLITPPAPGRSQTSSPARRRVQLSNTTVCVADTLTPKLAARALEICLDRCDFEDAILFSDKPVAGRFRNVKIEALRSLDDYSLFCLRQMPKLTTSEFVLVVQWDGYVVDPASWKSGFQKWDYIGAPIPSRTGPPTVGNGGFSLRSRKLLNALPSIPFFPWLGEDWIIAHVMKSALEEDFGIRFAPVELAQRFSHELSLPVGPTFGFHGVPNLPLYESDATIIAMFEAIEPAKLVSNVFFVLLANCVGARRAQLAADLYKIARRHFTADGLLAKLAGSRLEQGGRELVLTLEKELSPRLDS